MTCRLPAVGAQKRTQMAVVRAVFRHHDATVRHDDRARVFRARDRADEAVWRDRRKSLKFADVAVSLRAVHAVVVEARPPRRRSHGARGDAADELRFTRMAGGGSLASAPRGAESS